MTTRMMKAGDLMQVERTYGIDAINYIKTTAKKLAAKKHKPMPFETALRHVRRGKAVRRRAWHAESVIFRLGDKVFLKLPDFVPQERPGNCADYGSRPDFWKPLPQDFLATDWEIAR